MKRPKKRTIINASAKKGDYNTEIVTIENCNIINVQSDVIPFTEVVMMNQLLVEIQHF